MKTSPFNRVITFDISALGHLSTEELAGRLENGHFHKVVTTTAEVTQSKAKSPLRLVPALRKLGGGSLSAPVTVDTVADRLHDVLLPWLAQDPGVGLYQSLGFVAPDQARVDDLTGDPIMCVPIHGKEAVVIRVQLRERILPGKSVTEKLQERVAAFEKQEGRDANKKDWAILRDEVKAALLKTALVRRTDIPVIMGEGFIHIFTSSPAKAEHVNAYLRTIFGTWPVLPVYAYPDILSTWMKKVTGAHDAMGYDEAEEKFFPGQYAKMEDPQDDSSVTVKNEPAFNRKGYTVGELLERGYVPTEMDIAHHRKGSVASEDDDTVFVSGDTIDLTIRINSKGVIKKFTFGSISQDALESYFGGEYDADDTGSKHWLVYDALMAMITDLKYIGVVLSSEHAAEGYDLDDNKTLDIELINGGVTVTGPGGTVTLGVTSEGVMTVTEADPLDEDDITDAFTEDEDDEL